MFATKDLEEADRLMRICNACRYCEGLCAVFPAMEMRRTFSDGDLNYLSNLCHQCGACYYDCQYAPPHEFDVNVPRTLSKVRTDSYRSYAWPRAFAPMFERNGLMVALVASLSVAVFLIGFMAWSDPGVMFSTQTGEGAFYRIMPHNAMVAVFGAAFLYAIFAMWMGFNAFWKDIGASGERLEGQSVWQAMKDAGQLRYLDGGGVGCMNEDERPTDMRRHYHHATFYGFMLCLASTSVATIYHYAFGWEAPYSWYSLPVILGTVGGIGLVVGPAGLLGAKWTRDRAMSDTGRFGMDIAFLAMLFLVGATGLLLLFLRATPAMGTLLAIHLGFVFGFFITMPYGKFVHGLYRFGALVRYAMERRAAGLVGA
ncbi:tricarballylate utilization 4Fe-4S protein TcuB [Lutibaculum baratangense]|uniref:TcuB: works with TcuA to oxidize tricarballylate to cis-aconitate n=1 Tax=Lutibaculum baratangense AMV1 TaxID=631454 RepID=V4RQV9_9HYPH|nr:tricarballylate utilization 4Fe-4S protein TcuB [Lutibaculum baratangense]ESR25525.1 TcuB: works with TcuA to oxidize tricarballylate to cis-aconitate [Lutibaculum baratangense AMV1]